MITKRYTLPFFLLLASFAFAQELPSEESLKKISYAQGYDTGREIKANEQHMNSEKFLDGFRDVFEERIPKRDSNAYAQGVALALQLQSEKNPLQAKETLEGILAGLEGRDVENLDYSKAELEAATAEMRSFLEAQQKAQQQARQQQAREALQKAAIENKEKGEAFLRENATKDGVEVSLSQLQYKMIKPGDGPRPKMGDTVMVHYEGRLLDGRKFDSSIDRGTPLPVTIQKGQIIDGWVEALQLMKVGSRYKLWIPSELAYGQNARPLGPNQVLEFDVELIEIK